MPGPGPHMMYAMGVGASLTWLSDGDFGPHHTLVYVINAFFGPDIGSFSEWLGSTVFGSEAGSALADFVHHPISYVIVLGLPLCFLYSRLSRLFLKYSLLYSASGVALTKRQCLLLISAGSLSHFFLDHLFEENGHTRMYTWILSTGWWKNRAPINPDAVVIIGFLCTLLITGFVYINRVKRSINDAKQGVKRTAKLVAIVACLYGLWCASQIYWVHPPRPAVGEEADLGILVFLGVYFFLPHYLCILSMNTKDIESQQIPR